MVGMDIGGHEAHPDIAVRRALDPPAREDPGHSNRSTGQHHPRVILRRAGATMVDEGAHLDPLDRLDHEVRQIILRDPVPKIGRKQKRLVPLAVDKFAHGEILTENLPKVRHTASTCFALKLPYNNFTVMHKMGQ